MPEPAAGLTIRYEDSVTDRTRDGHDIVTNYGFHHHTTHDHSEEVIDVYQPFELTDENEALIDDLQEALNDRFPEESVELKYTGRKDRGDEVSVRYLFVIGQRNNLKTSDIEGEINENREQYSGEYSKCPECGSGDLIEGTDVCLEMSLWPEP